MGATWLLAYATAGLCLGWLFYRFPRLRDASRVQVACLTLVILGAAGTLLALDRSLEPASIASGHLHQGYLFLCASLIYLPTVVYILISQWNRLVLHLTSPGSRHSVYRPRNVREEQEAMRRHLEALRLNPVHAQHRRQLADCYLRLGYIHMATGEYLRAIECLERGYEQAHLLFKTARIFIDELRDLRSALPLLRRIIRIYPKSYFAAYARRVMNQYEARQTDVAL